MTTVEVADRCGVGRSAVLRWIAAGLLRAAKAGPGATAARDVSEADLADFLARRRPAPRPTRTKEAAGCTHLADDLTADDVEFGRAMMTYQRMTGRRWPPWDEVLAVAKSLGYRRAGVSGGRPAAVRP